MTTLYHSNKHKSIIEKRAEIYTTELTTKCKCGHSMIIPVQVDEKVCNYCGRRVKNTSRAYFKYKVFKGLENDRA